MIQPNAHEREAVTTQVLERCRSLGFALAGIAPVEPAKWAKEYRAWLERGEHGEMAYMARNVEVRIEPLQLLPGAKSIICVADRYAAGERDRITGEPHGRIARYARGDDYHVVMKQRLHAVCDELSQHFPDEQFRTCVDTAPILEREYAAKAGLGAIGKNTMLIAQGEGSYLLLGEVLTTLALVPSRSAIDVDPCESCTRCIDACPTDAITPWSVDATKCISYLTIEHRSPIDEKYHAAMGDWIFGCDICQEVCPHNQPTRRKQSLNDLHPAYESRRTSFDLLEVLEWDETTRREAFVRSSMKRAKLTMMKRNTIIAAGNHLAQYENVQLKQRIEAIARDHTEDSIVRETARSVLRRLEQSQTR